MVLGESEKPGDLSARDPISTHIVFVFLLFQEATTATIEKGRKQGGQTGRQAGRSGARFFHIQFGLLLARVESAFTEIFLSVPVSIKWSQ